MGIFLVITAAMILLDQAVKLWAMKVLAPVGTIPLINGVFQLTYAENTGSAFSLFQGMRWVVVGMTVALTVLLVFMVAKKYITGWVGILGAAFAVAGAVGNAIDRVWHGFVVDMFDFKLINFAIFNVADVFITIGAVMLIVFFCFLDGKNGGKKIGEVEIDGGK